LCTEGTPPDFETRFEEMLALLRKVEVWWIREIEIPTNPDFDGQNIPDSAIQPGRCLLMQVLFDIALRDIAESRAIFEQVRKGIDERSRKG
jgi:hypothetical protein